jgi:lipopolysaccharide/colanic/teichoic acid biosynthesis glycosyltransferase
VTFLSSQAQQDVAPKERPRSVLTRRRFQFAGALLIGALIPWLLRGSVLPGSVLQTAALNAFTGNSIAVTFAFWTRLSVETYPGIRRSYVILPSALTGHGLIVVWFLMTRFPYDRVALFLGFVLHVLWLYSIYLYGERQVIRRIAVVPYGGADQLYGIQSVEWLRMKRPRLADARGCDAIVADFSADLPDEWEAFLADAALAGRLVYQHKQLAESLTGRVEIERLSENSFGSLVPARGYFYLKGLVDFLWAVALLPVALPVMAVAAIAILLDDGGPVLFRQRRLGHSGRVFTAYKFRTMAMIDVTGDDSEVHKALATDEGDPRITAVGAVLRKFRIDELPQIFNILKWQMSWIGPRPEPELLTQWFISEIPFYRYRHVVKPGISGWAQVNQGYVSGLDGINLKLQYDFYYIKYFSPWLDLLIFLRTVKTILTGFGSR